MPPVDASLNAEPESPVHAGPTPSPRPRRAAGGLAVLALVAAGCTVVDPIDDDDTNPGDDDSSQDLGCIQLNNVAGYRYVQDAVDNAIDGDVVSLCDRTFVESVSITKAITLTSIGARARLQGVAGSPAVTLVGVSGGEVRHLDLFSDDAALVIDNSTGVHVGGLRANEGGARGIAVHNSTVTIDGTEFINNTAVGLDASGGSTVTVTEGSFQAATVAGIRLDGSTLSVEGANFAGMAGGEGDTSGMGIYAISGSSVTVGAGVSFAESQVGVRVSGGSLEVTAATFSLLGWGVLAEGGAQVRVVSSTFDGVSEAAITADGSGSLEGVGIAVPGTDNAAQGITLEVADSFTLIDIAVSGTRGGCIAAEGADGPGSAATVSITNGTLDGCGSYGIVGQDLASLDLGTLTVENVHAPGEGDGIRVQGVASLAVDGVTVTGAGGAGIAIDGSQGSLGGVEVWGAGAGGIRFGDGAVVNATAIVVDGATGFGVASVGGRFSIDGADVKGTRADTDGDSEDPLAWGAAVVAVDAGTGNTVSGFSMDGNTLGAYASASALTLSNGTLTNTGLDVVASIGGGTLVLSGVDIDGGRAGVSAIGLSADLTDVSVANLSGAGVSLQDCAAAVNGLYVDSVAGAGLAVEGGADATFEAVHIDGAGSAGILALGTTGSLFYDVNVSGAVDAGIRVQGGVDVAFVGINVDTVSGTGLHITGSEGVTVDGGAVWDATQDGVTVEDGLAIELSALESLTNLGVGLRISASEVATSGFWAHVNGGDGLYISSAASLLATDSNLSANEGHGLRMNGSSVTLDGCTVGDNGEGGLRASGGTLGVQTASRIEGNAGDGVSLDSGVMGWISGNSIDSNGGWGITCAGAAVSLSECHNTMSGNTLGNFNEVSGCVLGCTVD